MHIQTLSDSVAFDPTRWLELIQNTRDPVHLVCDPATHRIGLIGNGETSSFPLMGTFPALYPEWLGDQTFLSTHKVRFPYIVGEMANGIATAKMVIAAAQSGMMGFFGAAGLMPHVIEENLRTIQAALGTSGDSWGSNLIHSPQEPHLEEAAVDLYLRYGVRCVSASAYMALSPAVVHYACKGLTVAASGAIERRHHVMAKISRPEVAQHFLSPPPQDMLALLVQKGKLTRQEAELGSRLSVATDVTVEADSGGHTDNRPLVSLFPVILALAQKIEQTHGYSTPVRIGAAGGLGTPASVAAAFGLGAAYVMTGSVNQSAAESGLSLSGRQLLAQAGIADVIMAPAADMFELGVKLQVLKRGTMFGSRATKLYEIYTSYPSLEAIPAEEKVKLEQQIFQKSLGEIWESTRQFFQERDPQQIAKAAKDPKYQMALVFRWYLGLSSRWAIIGDAQRKLDYQIWCGPAMGAFNDWVKGSFLEDLSQRTVEQIGRNLLEGAAVITRAQQLRSHGLLLPSGAFSFQPRPLNS